MAMISVECPDCGRVLMRLPATGGTNQTKMCTGCKNRFRVIKDARTGSISFSASVLHHTGNPADN